jgi:hypothetical protein
MSSKYYDRDPFPHEDDANFERTLRNISKQEVMPRPIVPGIESLTKTSYEEFYGDTFHWNPTSIGALLGLTIKYFMSLTLSSTWPKNGTTN